MSNFKFTNFEHSDIASALPLPILPVFTQRLDAHSIDAVFFSGGEDKGECTGDGPSFPQARKIAELIENADIGYISLCDEKCSAPLSPTIPGSLRASVEEFSPNVFDIHPSDFTRKKHSNSKKKNPIIPSLGSQLSSASCLSNSPNPFLNKTSQTSKFNQVERPNQMENQQETGISKKRKSRQFKSVQGKSPSSKQKLSSEPTLNPTEILSEICFTLEKAIFSDSIPGKNLTFDLSLETLRMMCDSLSKLKFKSLLSCVEENLLVKILSLFRDVVKLGEDRVLKITEDEDSKDFLNIMLSMESIQAVSIIMSAPNLPKRVYSEEIIELVFQVIIFQMRENVLASLASNQQQPLGSGDVAEKNSNSSQKKKSYSVPNQNGLKKKSNVALIEKMCTVSLYLTNLIKAIKIQDSIIFQTSKTFLTTFTLENANLLQIKSIPIICSIFHHYPQHRTFILDEIVFLLQKFPSRKSNSLMYYTQGDENQIQVVSALIMHAIQSSAVFIPEYSIPMETVEQIQPSFSLENQISASVHGYEPCMENSVYVLKKIIDYVRLDTSEGRHVIEGLVLDFLSVLNLPEFPSASLLLQVLCTLFFKDDILDSKEATIRCLAIDALGIISARIKSDMIEDKKDELWILKRLRHSKDSHSSSLTSNVDPSVNTINKRISPRKCLCEVCHEECKSEGQNVCCFNCRSFFHNECIGHAADIHEMDKIKNRWFCYYCVCDEQVSSFMRSPPIANKTSEDLGGSNSHNLRIIRQILLNFLKGNPIMSSDLTEYAKGFYLCQWHRDDTLDGKSQPLFLQTESSHKNFQSQISNFPLSKDVVIRISRFLCQMRPLVKGFHAIFERLLTILTESTSTTRSKALKALSNIIESDPSLLGDDKVKSVVESHFSDSATSVRESALDLIGKHIIHHPDVAANYFDMICDRVMDTGTSVRKKSIKVLKEVCLAQPNFPKLIDAYIKMISRINDEEKSVKNLVTKTFHELWFDKIHESENNEVGLNLKRCTHQIVDVAKKIPDHQPLRALIQYSLSQDTLSNSSSNFVRLRCELMCNYLLECILQAHEDVGENSTSRTLPYISTLYCFCSVDCNFCIPVSDPTRFAITLQPYIKFEDGDQIGEQAQMIENIVCIIDIILTFLPSPPLSLIHSLEDDLRKLILKSQFFNVINACVKCLCHLRKLKGQPLPSLVFLFRAYYQKLVGLKNSFPISMQLKPSVLRALHTFGILTKFGDDSIRSNEIKEINFECIIETVKFYLKIPDGNIKLKSLQVLGFVLIANPVFMVDKEIECIFKASLSQNAEIHVKIQTLKTLVEILENFEENVSGELKEKNQSNKTEIGDVLPTAGDGDITFHGGLIQTHLQSILACLLHPEVNIRHYSLKVIELVLRQGLVHPVTCVSYLIALEVDKNYFISKLSHKLLANLNSKHPDVFHNRFGEGLLLSFQCFQLIKSLQVKSNHPAGNLSPSISSSFSATHMNNGIETSDLSVDLGSDSFDHAVHGIARVYSLLKSSRTSRNKFLLSIIRKFDVSSFEECNLAFLIYCAEIVASLPFSSLDEILYLIHHINKLVLLRSGPLISSLETYIHDGNQCSPDIKEMTANSRRKRNKIVKGVLKEKESKAEKGNSTNSDNDSEILVLSSDQSDVENGNDNARVGDDNLMEKENQKKDVEENLNSIEKKSHSLDVDAKSCRILTKIEKDCFAQASAVCLLLHLKLFLKQSYAVSDSRCQEYQPSEGLKPNENVMKRSNQEQFNVECLNLPPHFSSISFKNLISLYELLQSLVEHDSIEDFVGFENLNKRKRSTDASSSKNKHQSAGRDSNSSATDIGELAKPNRYSLRSKRQSGTVMSNDADDSHAGKNTNSMDKIVVLDSDENDDDDDDYNAVEDEAKVLVDSHGLKHVGHSNRRVPSARKSKNKRRSWNLGDTVRQLSL